MKLRDERGMIAIGGAVMLIVVLPLLATALWQYSMFEMKQVDRREKELQALYLARAGAEAAIHLWMDKPVSQRPEGKFERVYYDPASKGFSLSQPSNALGYFDVEIRQVEDPSVPTKRYTEIISTAVVAGVTRTVRATTYPFLFGHELGWYSESSGLINSNEGFLFDSTDGLVRVAASSPIRFRENTLPNRAARFSANTLVFEVPLNLAYRQTTSYTLSADAWAIQSKTLPIVAETIFFDDVIMLRAPSNYGFSDITYSVELRVPEGLGVPGTSIGGVPGSRYGYVFFDGDKVEVQEYRWKKVFLIFYRLVEQNSFSSIFHPSDGQRLAGRAFYFRDGMNLLRPQPGDLIPLEQESTRRDLLEQIRPFVWE